MKTVAYYRSSIDSQENSIGMQQNSVLTRSINMALIINEEYIDEAVSTRKVSLKKRPALQKLLQDINNNDVGTLFLFKRDRLARNVMEYYEIYQILRNKKINVILTAPNEPPVYYTSIGEYLELIMAGMAQREGEQIIEHTEELCYVKEIFNLYVNGHGFQYIANTLPNGSRRGKDWGKEPVS